MTIYAVVDTNVLVSAMLSGKDDAATVQVVSKVLQGEIVPVYRDNIMKEYREVLCRRKFGFSADLVNYLLAAIGKYGIVIEPTPSGITLPDMKDVPFFELVLEMRNDNAYLVTGNIKHFPKKSFIVTPREFLASWQERIIKSNRESEVQSHNGSCAFRRHYGLLQITAVFPVLYNIASSA